MNKKVHILGGGTLAYVRSHLALCAPAYGTTARTLERLCRAQGDKLDVVLHLTRMAGGDKALETVEDVARLLEEIVADLATKIVFVNVALCDFRGIVGDERDCHKHGPRLSTRSEPIPRQMGLRPVAKLIGTVRRQRKDILLVGFKHTRGASPDEQYVAGLHLVKGASCNLVLANDTVSRLNMVVTPEEARYHVTTDRDEALRGLVEMAYLRSHLTFTRSTVVAGDPVPWDSPLVPDSLRKVVNHCIRRGAYKPFRGSTAGHFAVKLDGSTFLTSRRKTDFNDLPAVGLVKVVTDGPDSVIAYGSKPSVGGQSQRIVFHDHPDHDCIVHFHCPIKPGSEVPQVSQREYECGSHECGQNTSRGLWRFGNLSAVYLQEHGPNIVFHRSIDSQEVISFIEANFDLGEKTGGCVTIRERSNTPALWRLP
jgi:ribulose-5-phosphate 4-epimerase/fuculose-1-phosphate aldolase